MINKKLVLILLLSTIVLFLVDTMYPLSTVRAAMEQLMRPLQEGIYHQAIRTVRYTDALFRVDELYEENRRLRVDLAGYHALQVENERVRSENELLRSRIGMPTKTTRDVVVTTVLGVESSGLRNSIIVDVGEQMDVEVNMIAIDGDSLIGRVIDITPQRSVIAPITDIESKVPVYIQKESGGMLTGLVEGNFNVGVKVTQVVSDLSLEPGDTIFTSGLGEIYPADIFVGVVKTVTSGRNEIFQEAEVTFTWNIRDLRTLLLVEAL